MAEAAGLPGYKASASFGIVGPARVPATAVATLGKAAFSSLEDPEVRKRMFYAGVEIRTSSPQDFARYLESELRKWEKVVKAPGAKVD